MVIIAFLVGFVGIGGIVLAVHQIFFDESPVFDSLSSLIVLVICAGIFTYASAWVAELLQL